ncbi:Clp protease N-terminal domain-containing protein [Nocardia sp. IFM 10818]
MIFAEHLNPELKRLIHYADRIAEAGGARLTGVEHLLLAMLSHPEDLPIKGLQTINLDLDTVLRRISEHAARQ